MLDAVAMTERSKRQRSEKPLLIYAKNREELYAREIDACLAQGKQALLIVPEVALIRPWEQKLRRYQPLTLASDMTEKKFFDAWRAVRNGSAQLVIGTRTAVFANFKNLECIIVDEEQNPHYKSQDMAPYYHTVTVAQKLAEFSGARLLLGSDAPSITSYYRALEGEYDIANNQHRNRAHSTSPSLICATSSLIKITLLSPIKQSRYLKHLRATKNKKLFFLCRGAGANRFHSAKIAPISNGAQSVMLISRGTHSPRTCLSAIIAGLSKNLSSPAVHAEAPV